MVTGPPKAVSKEPDEDGWASSLGTGLECGQVPSWDPQPCNQVLLFMSNSLGH